MSRYRDLRPHEPLPPKPARKRASAAKPAVAGTVPPPGPKRPDLGPRPVSARQLAHREAQTVPPPGPVPYPMPRDATAPRGERSPGRGGGSEKRRRTHLRDAETTHTRVRGTSAASRKRVRRRARNRRRVNLPRVLLAWASGVLVVECVAALLFSPRLWVKRIVVEGNHDIPAPAILARLKLGDHENIVRLPAARLSQAVLAEPRVETVEIHRRLPDTVRVVIKERTPWACAQLADGSCYIIDRSLVPFRTADVPPVGLPLLKLSGASQAAPPLGRPMSAPGLDQVSKCLAWANARPDFPLDAVSIDSEGKLCLNRAGGAKILLGSGTDLDKKLHSLETLIAQRADLRSASNVAYVNLYAYDAPAVSLRSAATQQDTGRDTETSAAAAASPSPPSAATKASP